MIVNGRVPEFPRNADAAPHRLATQDETGPDARRNLHKHKVGRPGMRTPGDLGECAEVRIILEINRQLQALGDGGLAYAVPFGKD